MARVTIDLPDEIHRALKAAAARRGRTVGEIVEESLEQFGIKPTDEAEALVARARRTAGLTEEQALEIAVSETRSHRHRH